MNIIKQRKVLILIIVGLLLSVMSYIYYFMSKNKNTLPLILFCITDIVFFFINSYTISKCFDKSKIFTILISFSIMLGFILFFEVFVIIFSLKSTKIILSWNLVYNVFIIALFTGPSLIILLPIIWFVCECLS